MKKSILAITEKENHQLYVSLSINGEKIEVCGFEDGVEKIKSTEADVIVLDCGSDGRNGIKLLSTLRAIRQDIPIVFITNEDSSNVVIQAFRTGARQYFQQPINIYELQQTIEELIKVKRTVTEKRTPINMMYSRWDEELNTIATADKPVNLLMVIQYIEDHIYKRITLEELAAKAKMSKYHFSRVFKQYIGTPPLKFVMLRKLERAKQLLKRHDFNVSTVAFQLGFNDVSTFIRQFKKFTGLTPAKANHRNHGH